MTFIDTLAPFAVLHGNSSNVLPSIIIAQSILESASGTSELAKNANNLFGIKAGSGWSGDVYKKLTGEYDSNKKYFEIIAEFRKYPTLEGCVIDLCHKYNFGTGWEAHNRYSKVLGVRDYTKVAGALYEAGYATDYKYPQKIIQIIEKYDLMKFDKEMDQQMVKIALDAGHGLFTAGKRSPSPENTREWEFNNKVLLAATAKLNTYENVQILRLDDPTGDTDVSLVARTNKANNWNADVLVSIHHNALAGKWHSGGGIETFVQEKTASKASKDIAAIINPRIVKAMGLRDRGVKTSNLHMTRSANAPAILTEGGFFDSTVDIIALRDDSKLKAQGEAIAEGLAVYFKLTPKNKNVAHTPTPSPLKNIIADNKGGTTMSMLISSSATLKKAYQAYLQEAINKGAIQKKWLDDYNKGQLTISDAIHLDILISNK